MVFVEPFFHRQKTRPRIVRCSVNRTFLRKSTRSRNHKSPIVFVQPRSVSSHSAAGITFIGGRNRNLFHRLIIRSSGAEICGAQNTAKSVVRCRNAVGKFLISESVVQSAPITPLRSPIINFIHFNAVDGDGSVTGVVATNFKPSLAEIESGGLQISIFGRLKQSGNIIGSFAFFIQ